MRHLVIDGLIFRLQRSGGISRVWAETLLGLESRFARENRVTLLLPRNENVEWAAIADRLPHIRVKRRRSFRGSFAKESFYLTRLALGLRPDIWHASYYGGLPRAFGGKRVVTFYDAIPEKMGCAQPEETQLKSKMLAAADRILSISEASQRDLYALWPDLQGKSALLPLCSTTTSSAASAQPYFVFVGRRSGYKNFESLVDALLSDPRFREYAIHVVGGESELSEHPRLIRRGTLSFTDVQKEIASSAALLFPSLYEGFGLPVLEAFQLGVPVLACQTSSIPEIVGPSYPLAHPEEPRTYTDVLDELLSNRERWIAYGKKRAERYTRAEMIATLEKTYNAL